MGKNHEVEHNNSRASHDGGGGDGASLGRRTSALEEVPTLVPPPGFPGLPVRRRSTASRQSVVTFSEDAGRHSHAVEDDDDGDDGEALEALTKSASAISRQASRRRESADNVFELPMIQRPRAAKPGLPSTIREVPSNLPTPSSTRPPSPITPSGRLAGSTDYFGHHGTATATNSTAPSSPQSDAAYETGAGQQAYPDVGVIRSWRGAMILCCTCGAQLMDNVFMTGVNIAR